MNYGNDHPERKPNEVFLGNVSCVIVALGNDGPMGEYKDYATHRFGERAYGLYPVRDITDEGFRPTFADREELLSRYREERKTATPKRRVELDRWVFELFNGERIETE